MYSKGSKGKTISAANINLEDQFVPLKVFLKGYYAGNSVEEVAETCNCRAEEAVSKKP